MVHKITANEAKRSKTTLSEYAGVHENKWQNDSPISGRVNEMNMKDNDHISSEICVHLKLKLF